MVWVGISTRGKTRVMILTRGNGESPRVGYPCCKHPPGARTDRWSRGLVVGLLVMVKGALGKGDRGRAKNWEEGNVAKGACGVDVMRGWEAG